MFFCINRCFDNKVFGMKSYAKDIKGMKRAYQNEQPNILLNLYAIFVSNIIVA